MGESGILPRVHLVAGGFPVGSSAGHDIDFVRRELLSLLALPAGVQTTVSNDFSDLEKWLPGTHFLITYVAGPFLTQAQSDFVQGWLEGGGRWLALHGSSGGKAVPLPEGQPGRRMSKERHHAVLGAFFLNHPPIRAFQVDVPDPGHAITRGLPSSFSVEDELYLIELQQPDESRVLLTTSDLSVDDPAPRKFGFTYDEDSSVGEDGRRRVLAYERKTGAGSVVYVALGHCHTPTTNIQPFVDASVDPEGVTPLDFQGSWNAPAFRQLLSNAMEWGLAGDSTPAI